MPHAPTVRLTTRHLRRYAHLVFLLAAATSTWADVFVSSEKDNAITVLQNDGTFIRHVPTCKRPRHMAWTNAGRHITVACGDSDEIGVVDIATGKQVDTLPTGESPDMFALSPDGKTAYVSIEEGSQMIAYDMAGKRPVFSVKTGLEPEGVLATPDGKLVYVASEVTGLVHIVDAVTHKQLGTVKVGKRPRRFALTPDGASLWVSNELGASVSVIDTASRRVKHTLVFEIAGMRSTDISPVGMVFTPDGKTAWVALGRANHVAEVDVATYTVRKVILTGKRTWGLGLNRDGSRLYAANGLSDDLTIIDVASGKPIKTVPVGRVPHSVLTN